MISKLYLSYIYITSKLHLYHHGIELIKKLPFKNHYL